MFSHLDEEERKQIFEAMYEVKYKVNDVIFRQGDEGDKFYVIESGECDFEVTTEDGTSSHVLTSYSSDSFGELALIYGSPRAATVKAKTDCKLWVIDRLTYRNIKMASTSRKI